MSPSLTILSIVVIALGVVPLIWPRAIFEYPFVVGMLLSVWLLPQAWAVERDGLAGAFDPTETWTYMTLCIIFLCAGYIAGRMIGKQRAAKVRAVIGSMYNEKRMTQASAALIAVGAISYVLMERMAATNDYTGGWTGIIIVYGLLAMCLVFGAALTFLIFLRTGDKFALILFVTATGIYLPILLISVKREFIFDFAVIIFGGLFLVRKIVPPRIVLIALCLIGGFIINKAGDIRGYVHDNDSSLVGALTSADVLSGQYASKSGVEAAEVTGAVTDIAIASELGDYHPFVGLYNGMVSRYFPAVIFGRNAKDSLMVKTEEANPLSNRAMAHGATRTGFSDTFLDYWYFGVLAFVSLGVLFGWLYSFAIAGGLRDQYLFVSLLGGGLHALTHGYNELVCSLPFMFLIVWLPFRYARVTKAERQKMGLLTGEAGVRS
ncbi:hypothetical protein GCM10009087_15360 [Sphingomonas oligophenolica]|uniref:Oligosaccharide repeat unit polymerase n=1 Tax=Sphingomonas oligophenolica TaxID=301154 RepID=A0ABU9YBY7_9SPHN